MILENNDIPSLVARIRKLNVQIKALETEQKELKAELRPIVEAIPGEKSTRWTDDRGYVRLVTRKPQVTFPGSAVEKLAVTWAASEDAIMCACGEMLLAERRISAGRVYLQVR